MHTENLKLSFFITKIGIVYLFFISDNINLRLSLRVALFTIHILSRCPQRIFPSPNLSGYPVKCEEKQKEGKRRRLISLNLQIVRKSIGHFTHFDNF